MQVQPYLFFDGRCEEAVEFYRRALGAQVSMLMCFKDAPPGGARHGPARLREQVMHTGFSIGDTMVMASDGRCLGQPSFQGFALTLTVPGEAEADRLFAALGDGGQVQMPLVKTFFSPRFGMVAVRNPSVGRSDDDAIHDADDSRWLGQRGDRGAPGAGALGLSGRGQARRSRVCRDAGEISAAQVKAIGLASSGQFGRLGQPTIRSAGGDRRVDRVC